MKISYNWLKEYVDFDYGPQELAEKLTNVGFEVEELYPLIQEFSGVVVGKVLQVQKHPDADKLSLCKVSDGKVAYQVICGAPNVAEGQIVPFALVGAVLPGGFKIKKAKIRGVESYGMICSKEELGLERKSVGIWPFEENYPLGEDVKEVLSEKQDYIFDLFITPNRPDSLSMYGIAREISAITGNPLKKPQINLREDENIKAQDIVTVNIHDAEGCPRYAARVIKGVTVKESPEWLKSRLESIGLRAINNVVDITNYVLFETGHPLHAFDLRYIDGPEINVRSSEKGEKFTTLDEKERELPENTVLICDKNKPVAIGGIMGGLNSEVTDSTVDILLESAYFKPERIAVSSKRLGLSTDASQRFERGADPNEGVTYALNRAAALISELAEGAVANEIVDNYPCKVEEVEIPFRPRRVNRVLGSNLDEKIIKEKLMRLGLKEKEGKIIVPTFRVDLKKEIDLIEEVARLVNFSNLPSNSYTAVPYAIEQKKGETIIAFLRNTLTEIGLTEAFTNGMLSEDEVNFFAKDGLVKILNPISDDMAVMRPSLLPGLLKTIQYNINRNMPDVRFFEIGRVFTDYKEGKLPNQPYMLSAAITGHRYLQSWNAPHDKVDFYDIKGLFEQFLSKIFLDNVEIFLYHKSDYLLKEEAFVIKADDKIIGSCGRLSDEVCKFFGIDNAVYMFELDVDYLIENIQLERKYKSVSRYPYSERDIAFVIPEGMASGEIVEYIYKIGGKYLINVDVFDIFKGGRVGEGNVSLGVRMKFQSQERTLNDKEVDKHFFNIINKTQKKFDITLRK